MTTEWKDITDQEELFRLKREGWEIEICRNSDVESLDEWFSWDGTYWHCSHKYRARPRQPNTKAKKVKMLAWIDRHGELRRVKENTHWVDSNKWIRQPHLDLEVEVPE